MSLDQDLAEQRASVRRAIGSVGVWTFSLERHPVPRERELAAEIEEIGYPALWIPEGSGSKEILSHAALLLSATTRVVVATGIASIWARDPVAMANGGRTLHDAFPGRFVLGLGVSHRPSVDRRGAHRYGRPYERMREYLEAMDGARYPLTRAPDHPPRFLAALGPKMLRLAAERAIGAHPYFVPVEHTARARETVGDGPVLAVEQAVVVETDPGRARSVAREYMGRYLKLENYANNLRRLGWTDEDLEGPTDRLVDAIVAWGDFDAVHDRVREHLDAGADHVCVQVLREDSRDLGIDDLRALAPALLEAGS